MKNITIITVLLVFGLTVNAQRTIEKNIDYKDQEIDVELDFATTIEIKTWEKPSVYIKADLSTEDEKYLDLYALNISEEASGIEVKSDAMPLFEAFQKEHKRNHSGEKENYIYISPKHQFNYILYVPKNSRVNVTSISGDLYAENIEGDFTADLISGNINIKDYKGNLKLETISGEIDLRMINTSLTAETIKGDIYADKKLNFTATDQLVGQKIAGKTAQVNSSLKLNTITGNMYLRY